MNGVMYVLIKYRQPRGTKGKKNNRRSTAVLQYHTIASVAAFDSIASVFCRPVVAVLLILLVQVSRRRALCDVRSMLLTPLLAQEFRNVLLTLLDIIV